MSDRFQGTKLSPEKKRELLAQLLQKKAIASNPSKSIFPLSQGQQALWFLYNLAPQSWAYNTLFTARIRSEVDVTALQRSFQTLISRHPSLRSTYTEQHRQPLQQIQDSPDVPFEQIEASAWSWDELNSQVRESAYRPFNLEQELPLRVCLFTRSATDHILLLVIHHIASDFWSLLVLMDELRVLYPAEKAGISASLPPLTTSYADYVQKQAEMLAGARGEQLWHYWQQQLAGELPVLKLPTDRPRPPIQTYEGASHHFKLNEELTQQLKSMAQQEKATLYMTFLAAFQVLLYRYTGQEDILVGSPTFGRNFSEFSEVVGYFVNPVVLRSQLADNPTFKEFLSQVRTTVLGAIAHQDYPFGLLVDRLQPNRDPSHSPLFQVTFAFQKPQRCEEIAKLLTLSDTEFRVNWGGLELEPFDIPQQEGQFDLFLEMVELDESLLGAFKYNTDLFDAATIARMEEHFRTLLEAIINNPEQRLSELPLLTPAERDQLLVEWNKTQVDYPQNQCIHQLFEAQVERTPDAIALVFENQELTYRELNHRANQLAHYLQKLGVAPETLVGICVERSVEMVVGLLGVLKAGGAYVPLDPAYPKKRLGFILEDAEIAVLLTQQSLSQALPAHNAKVVFLNSDWEKIIAQESQENPRSSVSADNLAYTIYTSGSTGRPKGVAIAHRNTVSVIHWTPTVVTPAQMQGTLASTSICFDLSILELFVPLSYGCTIILVENILQLPSLPASVAERITHLNGVPSAIAAMVQTHTLPPSIVSMTLGGEPLHNTLVQRLYQQSHLKRIINIYGPTETTTYSTCKVVERGVEETIDLGRPIANTQVYVLDQFLQPVPISVTGELYIGGAGITRGYLNRPELTAERFIQNPFSDDPKQRLYKTGDLVRYRPDSSLEYLGRRDYQVKVRGFRIELGEIEAVLSQHPTVREAVVTVQADSPTDKRLVAYIVPNQCPDQSKLINELRQFLKEKLPDYMVPAVFVILDAMPLTPNGKANRRALPAPDLSHLTPANTFVAPRTATEEVLAKIWAEVLGLKQVGIHDNFFELGGDSILSLQIVSRANQAGLQLSPQQLFQHQAIAQLAAVTGTTLQTQAEQGIVTGAVPLTPIQQWFFEQNLAEPHHFNQFVLLEVPPDLKPELLQQALQQLLLHHDALRLRFERSTDGWQQVNAAPDETIPFNVVDLSQLAPQEQQAAFEAATAKVQASLNLSQGSIVRATLFNLGINSDPPKSPLKRGTLSEFSPLVKGGWGGSHGEKTNPNRLLIVIHHLAVDGISWRILLEDLQTAYQQLSQGEAIKLAPKTTSFKQWASRLAEYGESGVASELDYWLTQSASGATSLPVDYPEGRNANTVASSAKVSVSLNAEQTRALLQDVPSAYHTQINDVLLTALVQSLREWSGKQTLLVNLEGHGREELFERVDISRTVGWFTSIFPVRLQLQASNPGEALKSIKEQLRQIPKRGIGYGILRYLSSDAEIRAKLESLPEAEVSFNYLGQLDRGQSEPSFWTLSNSGSNRSPLGNRRYLLEIDGFISAGKLQFEWTYSEKVHQRARIERLAQGFIEELRSLITHCQSPETEGYTPSDFPAARLNSNQLDKFMKKIKQSSRG
jgi:amino acid adenylation domain-containing protein/non-ribosomal peptide synthase protein (TIGR01720 family)